MRKSPLQEEIARLRRALNAASGIAEREGLLDLATALFNAANSNTPAERRAAVAVLEEDAGYIAGTGRGEAYP
jgi:hypothetical protein